MTNSANLFANKCMQIRKEFWSMKIRVDDVVKNEFLKSGMTKTQLAEKIGCSRNYANTLLEDPEMDIKWVVKIGKAIRYDFSRHFPELKGSQLSFMTTEPKEQYENMNNMQLREKMIETQMKYISLLEEHVQLLKRLASDKS